MSGFSSNLLLTLSLVVWVAVLVVWAPSSLVDLFTGRERSKLKADMRLAVAERVPGKDRRLPVRWVLCFLTPPFGHVYDAIFVPRPDLTYAYYEHCAICQKPRSWVDLWSNHGRPGSIQRDGCETIVYRDTKVPDA